MRRLSLVVLLVALAASLAPLHASPVSPEAGSGLKSASESAGGPSEAPAVTTWGMLVMILLVMGASTMTLLGGGIRNAVNTLRGSTPPPVTQAATPTPAASPAAEKQTQVKPERAKKVRKAPKNKSKRTIAQQRSAEQRRQQVRLAQRGATKAPLRKRGGPGCRGVR